MDEIRFFRLTPDCFSDNMLSPTGIKLYYRVNKKFPDTHIEEDPTVKAGTQLNICVSDANRHQNPRHIDFECPSNSCVMRTGYSSLLDRELIFQKMYRYCTYPVEVKQTYLRLSVRNGNYIKDLRRAIDRWCQVGTNDKLIDVNDAVLCILHLELRCTENKLSNL